MKVLVKKSFYIVPPIPYNRPGRLVKSALSCKKQHSIIKRLGMLLLPLIMVILNPILKIFGIWANNFYIVAQKKL
jgi:hypothetical protein